MKSNLRGGTVSMPRSDGTFTGYPSANSCPCGSGMYPRELKDARGIYCCKICDKCEKRRRAEFRAEIFTDPNYSHDEPIDDA